MSKNCSKPSLQHLKISWYSFVHDHLMNLMITWMLTWLLMNVWRALMLQFCAVKWERQIQLVGSVTFSDREDHVTGINEHCCFLTSTKCFFFKIFQMTYICAVKEWKNVTLVCCAKLMTFVTDSGLFIQEMFHYKQHANVNSDDRQRSPT